MVPRPSQSAPVAAALATSFAVSLFAAGGALMRMPGGLLLAGVLGCGLFTFLLVLASDVRGIVQGPVADSGWTDVLTCGAIAAVFAFYAVHPAASTTTCVDAGTGWSRLSIARSLCVPPTLQWVNSHSTIPPTQRDAQRNGGVFPA
jgi:hypothetical protein